ncbi:NAD-dependent epimerase/dehydratase family protein [Nannocystis punicea]|uniref:NAD-dependent epimerase/dehydratase family protein n=1 Tax=Nannocystis punicea TaxID=2995304 RepID=A0ABY7GWZ8_9BACT|nr:NAD-dependent epimerase/dehydratase family protein [Nannocystis poenicansa]WAS91513.1 NAD-dependent epimerase/dehydratase family protein [Nannocystis poenicansa]
MRCLVTGAAGFVGSHLSERLVELGHEVVGVDRLSDYYPLPYKQANLARLRREPRFRLEVADLARCPVEPLLADVDVVFHQAAQAGVRASWGASFQTYLDDNVLSTQRILEAVRRSPSVRKVVYASSSSVYGQTGVLPMRESSPTRPFSPYGVTKLAAEHLVELYRHNFGVPGASLRYFTVYGPRQRPDMGFHRFIEAALDGHAIEVYGDGLQTRDFTFIDDIVDANLRAAEADVVGVFNIGGGARVTLRHVLETLQGLVGELRIDSHARAAGDVLDTWADTGAAAAIGYAPRTCLHDGLAAQVAWHRERRARGD